MTLEKPIRLPQYFAYQCINTQKKTHTHNLMRKSEKFRSKILLKIFRKPIIKKTESVKEPIYPYKINILKGKNCNILINTIFECPY